MSDDFRLRAWMVSALRSVFRRWPPFGRVLKAAKREYFVPTKMGGQRRRVEFKCSKCQQYFNRKQIQVDHTYPVVSEEGFPTLPDGSDDFNTFIRRLFVSDDKLSCMCKSCHKIKTQEENKARREYKKMV